MDLFSRKAGNRTINFNGKPVKFVNCVATVDDAFGAEILKLGFPDLYEKGKEPAYQTPKEVALKSDFKDREAFYQKELARLTNVSEARAKKVKELEAEVKAWKEEYEKEHALRVKGVETPAAPTPEPVTEAPAEQAPTDPVETVEGEVEESAEIAELRKELKGLTKKADLVKFGEDAGIDMTAMKEAKMADIIEYIIAETNK